MAINWMQLYGMFFNLSPEEIVQKVAAEHSPEEIKEIITEINKSDQNQPEKLKETIKKMETFLASKAETQKVSKSVIVP